MDAGGVFLTSRQSLGSPSDCTAQVMRCHTLANDQNAVHTDFLMMSTSP